MREAVSGRIDQLEADVEQAKLQTQVRIFRCVQPNVMAMRLESHVVKSGVLDRRGEERLGTAARISTRQDLFDCTIGDHCHLSNLCLRAVRSCFRPH